MCVGVEAGGLGPPLLLSTFWRQVSSSASGIDGRVRDMCSYVQLLMWALGVQIASYAFTAIFPPIEPSPSPRLA